MTTLRLDLRWRRDTWTSRKGIGYERVLAKLDPQYDGSKYEGDDDDAHGESQNNYGTPPEYEASAVREGLVGTISTYGNAW